MSENLGNLVISKLMSLFLETSEGWLWKALKLDETSRKLENTTKKNQYFFVNHYVLDHHAHEFSIG